jgi:hypothetical protein
MCDINLPAACIFFLNYNFERLFFSTGGSIMQCKKNEANFGLEVQNIYQKPHRTVPCCCHFNMCVI